MKSLTKELIQELITVKKKPCLSLYMTTHRNHPENLQDPVRYEHLIKELEKSLSQNYSDEVIEHLISPFKDLINDGEFWKHSLDGLAVFRNLDLFEMAVLHQPVDNLAIVADSFHTKPIRQYMQSLDHYHVLSLTLHEIRLFEGNRHSLAEVKLPDDIPKTLTQALGEEVTNKHLTVASYGGQGVVKNGMHHGHGSKKDEMELDAIRFFRIVAKEIYSKYSKPTGWPLLLAALPEHHNLFHKVSKNPMLLDDGIDVNPQSVNVDALAKLAWNKLEPEHLKKLDLVCDRFEQVKVNGKGSDNIKAVAAAAAVGKVKTLIIESGRIIPGRITNELTGNIQNKDLNNPLIDDLLDDIGELVTKKGGNVFVLPSERMPSLSGIAAIYRY